MPLRKIDRVRKRDGRTVPYDEAKIAEAIARAARAIGQEQASVGRDLAGIVTMYLERYYEREVPASDEIRQMVEKTLIETGNEAIARSFPDQQTLYHVLYESRFGRLWQKFRH